jgi:hypothetical protein
MDRDDTSAGASVSRTRGTEERRAGRGAVGRASRQVASPRGGRGEGPARPASRASALDCSDRAEQSAAPPWTGRGVGRLERGALSRLLAWLQALAGSPSRVLRLGKVATDGRSATMSTARSLPPSGHAAHCACPCGRPGQIQHIILPGHRLLRAARHLNLCSKYIPLPPIHDNFF